MFQVDLTMHAFICPVIGVSVAELAFLPDIGATGRSNGALLVLL